MAATHQVARPVTIPPSTPRPDRMAGTFAAASVELPRRWWGDSVRQPSLDVLPFSKPVTDRLCTKAQLGGIAGERRGADHCGSVTRPARVRARQSPRIPGGGIRGLGVVKTGSGWVC